MWALRRSANPCRCNYYRLGAHRAFCAKSDLQSDKFGHGGSKTECDQFVAVRPFSPKCFPQSAIGEHFRGTRTLSSQAGAKSSDEEELEAGFSELETPQENDIVGESTVAEECPEDIVSESEVSDDEPVGAVSEASQNDLGLLDVEVGQNADKDTLTSISTLFKVILGAPRQGVSNTINKWVEEGYSLGRDSISVTMLNLRKFKLFGKALQFMEWLEANKRLEFTERNYASYLDLVAKVRGLKTAQQYFRKIPPSFQGEIVYRTLLTNCVASRNISEAEEIFNKMKDLGFPMTEFSCNQMLLLYKKCDRKKIADVLLMMEKGNVKPSLFTYVLLIDTEGKLNNIAGMEQVVATMKAEGIQPNLQIQSLVARYYIYGNFLEKAEEIIQELEGGDIKENRAACPHLLRLYADLGKADDVARVWKVCEDKPRVIECLFAIEAWGKLGQVEKAEKAFEKMQKMRKKLSPKYYTALLKVYADNKLLSKGKDLLKKMSDVGCLIGPLTWDALVKLHVEAGEVEMADSILQKACQNNNMKPFQRENMKPLYRSYISVLSQYAKRGDVHNAEMIFQRLRMAGYLGAMQYETLLKAYINAKLPAYGFRERLKADNVFLSRNVAGMMVQLDVLKK